MSFIRICPSILSADFDRLPEEIARIAAVADMVHLDVMDNIFVPNFTFDLEKISEIVADSSLPSDIHLMVEKADINAPAYAKIGAASVTFHYEAANDVGATLKAIKDAGVRAGLAIKPGTSIDVVKEFLPLLDMIVVMTVEPGFGGQAFMSQMMEKVTRARDWLTSEGLRDTWLQVDGGISEATIEVAALAGADTFVAGSAVFRSLDPAATVSKLRAIAEDALSSKLRR